MSHIDAHIYSSDPLSDLAEKFSYNYSYLSALFRKTTGKKLSEYCRERKMETAKVLLLEGKKGQRDLAAFRVFESVRVQPGVQRVVRCLAEGVPRKFRAVAIC